MEVQRCLVGGWVALLDGVCVTDGFYVRGMDHACGEVNNVCEER